MDPTGFQTNMNYSVRLSDLEPPRNAVEDLTRKLRAMIKTVPQAIHHGTRTHTLGGIECVRDWPPSRGADAGAGPYIGSKEG
jgi:hypothetical protein